MHIELPAGIRQFPFSFILPHSIPTSVEIKNSDYGCYVKYSVKAVMKRSSLKSDYVSETPIFVNTIVDVNLLDTPVVGSTTIVNCVLDLIKINLNYIRRTAQQIIQENSWYKRRLIRAAMFQVKIFCLMPRSSTVVAKVYGKRLSN